MENVPARTPSTSVFYFDGVCGLCNGAVDFFMRIDAEKRLSFSPLQSEYARRTIGPALTETLSTLVLRTGARTFTKSTAIASALIDVGGAWQLWGYAILLVPRFLRDAIYDWVARHRYGFFGKRETCRIPTPDERARFIET